MPETDTLLRKIEVALHKKGMKHIRFHQESVKTGNMRFSDGKRNSLCIQAGRDYYDVSLSGVDLTKEMKPTLTTLFGHAPVGYKFRRDKRQPYWRTQDFKLVRSAIEHYAETRALP